MLTTTKSVLSAPLPRVFEESANGKAVPVAMPAQGPIGGGFQQEELVRISKETVSTRITQLLYTLCKSHRRPLMGRHQDWAHDMLRKVMRANGDAKCRPLAVPVL